MNRTAVIAAVVSLVGSVASAQPVTMGNATGASVDLGGLAVTFGVAGQETREPGFAFTAGSGLMAAAKDSLPVRLNLSSAVQAASFSLSASRENGLGFWLERADTRTRERSRVDWLGLINEQVRIDAIMHLKRLTEAKTHREVMHGNGFQGYLDAMNGYFNSGYRWSDGDPFLINNINHPIMGAVSSRVYTNNDRRCKGVGYGEKGYWACVGRATAYSFVASVNWEWNPLMSESAIGHAGKAYTCVNGKCSGEGGWTDFVMTPLGGAGFRIAGDIARAKLWPTLDRHLSGNLAARILKNVVKVMTDPSGMANCAFNLNFTNLLATRPFGARR